MTKYRLKDAELQAKLDEISGGDFSKRLQEAKSEKGVVTVCFGKPAPIIPGDREPYEGHAFLATLLKDELEIVPSYDPHAWNEWPAVTPPEGPLMRLEYNDQIGAKRKACATYFNGEWISFDGFKIEPRNARFRPWEEE